MTLPSQASTATPAADRESSRAEPARGPDALPSGTLLGEFEIERVLSESERGIVYLAVDPVLQRQVVIKEYLPAALAARGHGAQVTLRAPSHQPSFVQGLRAFINEAQLLVRFDHPSLMRVYRCWEANRTAYMAMPYYEGRTLQETRQAMAQPPSEAWLRALFEPLLEALQLLHGASCYHLNIAPEHILLLPDGRPVLFDLAVRDLPGERGKAQPNSAYAPIEQYAETEQLRLGPWTDLYSLAAVVYFCINGRAPLPATARAVGDEQSSLSELAGRLGREFVGSRYSKAFLEAFDWALAIRPKDRPQRVAQLRQVLTSHGGARAPAASAGGASESQAAAMAAAPPVTQEAPNAFATRPPLSPRELGERWHATVKNAAAGVPPVSSCAAEGRSSGAASNDPFEASIKQALQSALTSIEEDERNSRFSGPSMFGMDATGGAHSTGASPPSRGFEALADDGQGERPHGRGGKARVHWWSRPLVRWGLGALAIVLLVGFGVLRWQGDRRTEQALSLMARALPSAAEPELPAASNAAGAAGATVQPAPAASSAGFVAAASPPPAPPVPASSQATAPVTAAAESRPPAAGHTQSGMVTDEAVPARHSETQVASVKARAQAKADAEPSTPRAACGGRAQFALYYCMQTQCRKPAFAKHAQCKSLREHDAVE